MEYEVIDNFLPDHQYIEIYNTITGNNMPWYYVNNVAYNDGRDSEDWYMIHTFYSDYSPISEHFKLLYPLVDKLNVKAMIRAKANFYPNIGRQIENEFHRDQDYPHKGFIYYLNTNNGYTIFEDGTKIESVANRGLLFDSSEIHKSTHCTDQKVRYNINFNYF